MLKVKLSLLLLIIFDSVYFDSSIREEKLKKHDVSMSFNTKKFMHCGPKTFLCSVLHLF